MTSANSASSLPVRQAHSRHHSHSVSGGSYNPSHRITRRKSVSSNAVPNAVAIAAAVREVGGDAVSAMSASMPLSSRRNTNSRTTGAKSGGLSTYPTPPSSLPSHKSTVSSSGRKPWPSDSVIEDDPNEEDEFEGSDTSPELANSRARRASEGQYLNKGDGKRVHGAELKCEKCGKGYKHSSCLSKHLWEHTPEWNFTSKLLISKHQQVQLLEAASVLMVIQGDNSPPLSAKDFHSDQEESSASPAASGYSDLRDSRQSSAYTTPPPQAEHHDEVNRYRGDGFSMSYPSAPSISNSVPHSLGWPQHQQSSERFVLSPSLTAISTGNKEEDEGLANAIDLLSCGFNTPQTRVTAVPLDIPPIPQLPPQYASLAAQSRQPSGAMPMIDPLQRANSYAQSERYHNYSASERYHSYDNHQPDVKMEDGDESNIEDHEYERSSRGGSDEDDEGVFGRMEE